MAKSLALVTLSTSRYFSSFTMANSWFPPLMNHLSSHFPPIILKALAHLQLHWFYNASLSDGLLSCSFTVWFQGHGRSVSQLKKQEWSVTPLNLSAFLLLYWICPTGIHVWLCEGFFLCVLLHEQGEYVCEHPMYMSWQQFSLAVWDYVKQCCNLLKCFLVSQTRAWKEVERCQVGGLEFNF